MAEPPLAQRNDSSSSSSSSSEETATPEGGAGRYLDRLFPSDSSLEKIDAATASIKRRHQTVVDEIRQVVHEQSGSDKQRAAMQRGGGGVEATKAAIDELYTRISEMRAKARTSERMVLDITQDIKALDFAKRNLTHTTATMRRLQLLIGSVEQLRRMKDRRMYADAAKLVPAVAGLREGFSEFAKVKQVAGLSEAAGRLQRALGSQAYQDVERAFEAQQGVLSLDDHRAVHDACLCLDALGGGERARTIDMYCGQQLRAYAAIFQLDDDASQLENVSRRYAWLRRILRNYTEEHAALFPARWRVGEELSRRFAELTRDHLGEIMATTRGEIRVDHLMAAMADTMAFEAQCDKRFGIGRDASLAPAAPAAHGYGDSQKPGAAPFAGLISCAFEPYMSVFIRAEQAKFDGLVAGFQQDAAIDDDPSLTVLASSTDLLYQFRESLRQCAALSAGQAMVDLSQVFDQCLGAYARDVLTHKLPRTAPSAAPQPAVLGALRHMCLVVNTADYCASVAAQLEQKIVERLAGELKPKVTFAACREALLAAINAGIRALVAAVVDTMCAPAFAMLAQVPWQTLHMVGDQSGYVMLAVSAMDAASQTVRHALSATRYFRSFCDKFAASFADKYAAAIASAGPISEVGAEQLLLDAQALKSALQGMPTLGIAAADRDAYRAPPAYARIVAQRIGNIEATLKAVLAPSDPPDVLVDRFLLLFPAAPRDTFLQILSLKGIRPPDIHAFSRVLRRKMRDAEADAAKLASQSGEEARAASNDASLSAALVGGSSGGGAPASSSTYATPEPKDSIPSHVAYGMSSSAPISSTRLHQLPHHKRHGLNKHARLESSASSSSSMVFGSGSGDYAGGSALGASTPYAQAMPPRRTAHADPLGITGADASSSLATSARIGRAGRNTASVLSSPGEGGNARQPPAALPLHQTLATSAAPPLDRSSAAEDIDLLLPSDAAGNNSTDSSNSPVFSSLAANATATRTKLNDNFRKFMNNMRRN
ncbi:Vacuolar protein sorting-associated protein 53 [Coemansia erecta]|nr:Vacuolar protein sorting-associated protein 53 [Coemansia erecta]